MIKKIFYGFTFVFIAIILIAILTPCYTNVGYFFNTTDKEVVVQLSSNGRSSRVTSQIIKLPPNQTPQKINLFFSTGTSLCLKVDDLYDGEIGCYGYIEPFHDMGKDYYVIGKDDIDYVYVQRDEKYLWLVDTLLTYFYRQLSCAI